jgi:hypothetical protein
VEQLLCIMEIMGPPPRDLIDAASRRKVFFDASGAPNVVPNSRGESAGRVTAGWLLTRAGGCQGSARVSLQRTASLGRLRSPCHAHPSPLQARRGTRAPRACGACCAARTPGLWTCWSAACAGTPPSA